MGVLSSFASSLLAGVVRIRCFWMAGEIVHTGFLQNDEVEPSDVPPAINQMVEYKRPNAVLITGGTAMWKLAGRFYASAATSMLNSG